MAESEDSWGGTSTQDNVEFPGADWGSSGGGSYTEVTHTGFFERLLGSLVGGVIGLVLFLGSFALLYWNEGRQDMSEVAKTAVAVNANQPAAGQVGKLVAVTGAITTDETLGDAYLQPGPYIALRRSAQMYAWDEDSHTETKKHAGGSETKVTTYTYDTEWTSSPDNSDHFKRRGGHYNPPMRVKGETLKVDEAKVGRFELDMDSVGLPSYDDVTLSAANTKGGVVGGGYLYLNDRGHPHVGDIRLTYDAVRAGQTVTLFGRLDSATHVASYQDRSGESLYRAVAGTKDEAVKTMHGEFVMMTWILRLVGFAMMWGGMCLMTNPINTFMDVLPILGDLGREITGFVSFVIAVPLTVVTILVAKVMHNLLAMIVVGVLIVLVGGGLFGKKKDALTRKVKKAA